MSNNLAALTSNMKLLLGFMTMVPYSSMPFLIISPFVKMDVRTKEIQN